MDRIIGEPLRPFWIFPLPSVQLNSAITEQTFEWSAIAAKLIRWHIRTWLSDTAVFIFTRRASARGESVEGFWAVARFIPVFSKLWLTPACNMLLHTVCLVERISMGFTVVEYRIRVGQNIASWKVMAVLLRSCDLSLRMKIVRRRSPMVRKGKAKLLAIGDCDFSWIILYVPYFKFVLTRLMRWFNDSAYLDL